jgi:hypothetical protein
MFIFFLKKRGYQAACLKYYTSIFLLTLFILNVHYKYYASTSIAFSSILLM